MDVVIGSRRDGDHEDCCIRLIGNHERPECEHTKLNDNFPKVVWMSRLDEETDVAYFAFVCRVAPEAILLNIRHCLHEEANSEQYNSSNVSSGSKFRLVEPRHIG